MEKKENKLISAIGTALVSTVILCIIALTAALTYVLIRRLLGA